MRRTATPAVGFSLMSSLTPSSRSLCTAQRGPASQAGIRVSDPGDPLEREADEIADQVVVTPAKAPTAERANTPSGRSGVLYLLRSADEDDRDTQAEPDAAALSDGTVSQVRSAGNDEDGPEKVPGQDQDSGEPRDLTQSSR
jgi:hypothetical protein